MAVRGSTSVQFGGSNNPVSFTGVADGDWVFLFSMMVSSSGAVTTPAGWTLLKPRETIGTRQAILFGKIWHTGDPTTVNLVVAADGVKSIGVVWGDEGPETVEEFVVGASRVRSTVGASGSRFSNIAPSVTVPAGSRVLAFSCEATVAAETGIASVNNGMTEVFYQAQNGSTFLETLWVGTKVVADAGPSGDTTIVCVNQQDNNGWAVQVGLPPSVPEEPRRGFANVAEMLATYGATWAHRGGSLNWPEMSEFAYDQAVAASYPVLEFSAGRTTDSVWFGLHDTTLNRTSQTTGLPNVNTMTWAQVQTYQNTLNSAGTPRPYYRLIDFLDKYTPTHVVLVDPKYEVGRVTEFLDILDAHGGPAKIIVKFYGVGTGAAALATAARARGYKTWGYFYDTDIPTGDLATYQGYWDILGMNYEADQTAWNTITSYGKSVAGHIIQGQASYDTAMSKGATFAQVANVAGVAAVGPEWGGVAGGGFSVGGGATGKRTARASGTGGFSVAGTAAGERAPEASATGGSAWSGSATSSRASEGLASGSWTVSGAAEGSSERAGAASGGWAASGGAEGVTEPFATASGGSIWAGMATSDTGAAGTATGGMLWGGSAAGERPSEAQAGGGAVWSGAAGGAPMSQGQAEGGYAFGGVAAGEKPSRGAAGGAVEWSGGAEGTRESAAAAFGGALWAGLAYAETRRRADAAGGYFFGGYAQGDIPEPVDHSFPERMFLAGWVRSYILVAEDS
ncbi:minor tail protein [Microbacterium phage Dewdrop]|nr:minor tail protein [Microbacterium phage Leaf]QGZ17435.1 minor tail protein [Microbacterium phage Dewdrop]